LPALSGGGLRRDPEVHRDIPVGLSRNADKVQPPESSQQCGFDSRFNANTHQGTFDAVARKAK
jgi:hypothetical protein